MLISERGELTGGNAWQAPKPSWLKRLRHNVGRVAVALRLTFPFPPVNPNVYIRLAKEHFFAKLKPEEYGGFTAEVTRFLIDYRFPENNMTILEALSTFDYDNDQTTTMLDPEDETVVLPVVRRRMVEVLLRDGRVYFALFMALGGKPRKQEQHHKVHSWRDVTNRRIRYLTRQFGELRQVDVMDRMFIFEPNNPIVVFSPDIPPEHPLAQWIPRL